MTTTANLIRRVDGVELPASEWWAIAAGQPVSLRTTGLRRRTMSGTVSGGVTIADDPCDSTIDLHLSTRGGAGTDLAIHAALVSADADGVWRFAGSVAGTVTVPIVVDIRYRGVFRRAGRATAWLTVHAGLPRLDGRPRLVLDADVNAELPPAAAQPPRRAR
jgi:hypothetical protein